jgi:predicted porin
MEIYRMKKSLLAIAAMTAFAGAAQAQSSVTVYGILDVGFVGSNYNGTSITANAANVNNSGITGTYTSKQTTAAFGQSAESSSRIGFKGTEDLGGGTSAVFTVELGLSPDSNGATYNANAGGTPAGQPGAWGQINRQSFVGLSKNGVGTATIGTQYTPIFDVQSITDAAGNNNLLGNAVYSGTLQSSTGTYNSGLGPYAGSVANQSLNADTGAYTTRLSNSIKFQSAKIAGFTGQLFYAQANQNNTSTAAPYAGGSNGAGGTNNATAWGLNGNYVWNKLQVVAAYQAIKSYDPSGAQITAFDPTAASYAAQANAAVSASKSTLAAGTADSFGYNMVDAQTYAAGVYDFGILKGYLQYITRRAYSTLDQNQQTSRSAYQIGARSQLTPTISAYATMGLGKSSYYGANLGYNNFRTFQIGADYNLSKRTNLYVAAGAVNQSSAGGTTLAPQNVGTNANNYALGVRHTF